MLGFGEIRRGGEGKNDVAPAKAGAQGCWDLGKCVAPAKVGAQVQWAKLQATCIY